MAASLVLWLLCSRLEPSCRSGCASCLASCFTSECAAQPVWRHVCVPSYVHDTSPPFGVWILLANRSRQTWSAPSFLPFDLTKRRRGMKWPLCPFYFLFLDDGTSDRWFFQYFLTMSSSRKLLSGSHVLSLLLNPFHFTRYSFLIPFIL